MDPKLRTGLLVLGGLFCVMFGLLTIAALATAVPNIGSAFAFGLSALIIVLIGIGIVGAIRNPPDE
jgi:glycerol uptake facilitator-like aquaporin